MLVRDGPALQLYDATPQGATRSKKTVSTAGLMVDRVPAEEWRRSSTRSGGATATSSTSTNMHGYDWEALREQYEPLLQYVAHRSDLNYVIGEMIAELNVQHAYVEGGDLQTPAAAAGRPARRALRARRGGGPLPDREDLRAARTRRRSTARR